MVALAAAIVAVDTVLKRWALNHLPLASALDATHVIDLAIHKNEGIAFDIPFRMPFVILLSAAIIALLARVAFLQRTKRPDISAAALVMAVGAVGNLIDRVTYGFTVDYLLFFGRSAINLSDLCILAGVLLLLFAGKRVHKPA